MPVPGGAPLASGPPDGVPDGLARKVLVNLALDGARRRTRDRAELGHTGTSHPVEPEDEAAMRVLGGVETTTDLTRALGDLAPRQRAVLVFRYLYDLSEAQVADVMGCSVGTVKSTTSRALQRLRVAADTRERCTRRNQKGASHDED